MRNLTALTTAPDAALMAILAKNLATSRGESLSIRAREALVNAERTGAPQRVQTYLKALVGAGSTGDATLDGLVDANIIVTAFISTLRNRSVFYSLLDDGMVKVPLRTRFSAITASATAFIVGEGAAVPVSKLGIKGQTVDPARAAALVVLTDEMVRSAGPAGEAVISRELRRGVTAAVDAQFFDMVVDGDTPTFTGSGTGDAEDVRADLRRLLAAVAPTAESRIMFALAPDVARGAATLTGALGAYVFPEMGPTGGRILNTDAMVSDQLEPGTVMLLDSAGIVGNSDTITVDASGDTTVELRDDPTGDTIAPTGGTTMVSMFQTNSVAIMAQAYFGAERVRDNAVAVVTGASWGGDESGS